MLKKYLDKLFGRESWVGRMIDEDYKALCRRQERTEYQKWIEHLPISGSDKRRLLKKEQEVSPNNGGLIALL